MADDYRSNPGVLLNSSSSTKTQRGCWVSVGTLAILRIGDIWRNQQLELRPDYELESFQDVRIDRSTTLLVKAGHSLEDGRFLLPLDAHPWHRTNTHSFCVVVGLGHEKQLVVPCCELIRFYFGASGSLLSKLFQPPLVRKALYRSAEFEPSSGKLTMELAENISGVSAADIGRLCRDPIAWRAALQVGTSMLKAQFARQAVHPQSFFPFEGMTTLEASGKWLPLGDRRQATFVVYSLRSCSHAFPFRSLRYDSVNDAERGQRDAKAIVAQTGAFARGAAPDARDQSLVERDASNNLTAKTKPFLLEPRFPDLRHKPVWKRQSISSQNSVPPVVASGAPAIDEAAIGESGSEQRIRPVELAGSTLEELASRQPAPAFLRDIVDDLMRMKGLDIELLTRSGEDGWTDSVPFVSHPTEGIDEKLFIEHDKGETLLRRIAAFSLRRENECKNAVFIESSPVHVRIYSSTTNAAESLWDILDASAADFVQRQQPLIGSIADEVSRAFEQLT